ncbi:hypothetical protein [Streptomyces sp. NBC_01367]|uniref:hypothetical protein n=1 Tax=Streptomyces sp. NBC_01367 TaxID=2903841 RepID=UPI0032560D44
MKDALILAAAVFAAIAALTTFAIASGDVTNRQEKLVEQGIERGDALQQAQREQKRLCWFLAGVPAAAAVALNIGAFFVAPAEPLACVERPAEHSSPTVTPSRPAEHSSPAVTPSRPAG